MSKDSNASQERASTLRQYILEQASLYVSQEREESYGPPKENFDTTAALWRIYLAAKQKAWEREGNETSYPISSSDIALLQVLMKVSRHACGEGKLDTFMDIAGYAALAAELD